MEAKVQEIQPAPNSSTHQPCPASGISSPGSDSRVIATQLIRAEPTRRASDFAAIPPATPPTAPSASSSPTRPGRIRRVRIRKTGPSVSTMITKKLAVPLKATALRRIGSRTTCASPAPICARRVGLSAAGAGVRTGSRVRIAASEAADTAKDSASAVIAAAAPTSVTRPAPAPGPAICAADCEAASLPLPSISCSWSSRVGR